MIVPELWLGFPTGRLKYRMSVSNAETDAETDVTRIEKDTHLGCLSAI